VVELDGGRPRSIAWASGTLRSSYEVEHLEDPLEGDECRHDVEVTFESWVKGA